MAFVKMSTGYGFTKQASGEYNYKGAIIPHLELMKKHVSPNVQVKTAGVVRTPDDLLRMRALGITRVGATAMEAILDEAVRRAICRIDATSGDAGDCGVSGVLSVLLGLAAFDDEPPNGQRYLRTLDRLVDVGVLADVGVVGVSAAGDAISAGLLVSIGLGAPGVGLSSVFGAGVEDFTFSTDLTVTGIGRGFSAVAHFWGFRSSGL
ncbi:uncharacterized protein PAC_12517 [Phialocephala subalpina]|uniref:Deoxyribose-phosphate aldolase n=1 Tax=Phialocephala subalpina TaxID=576137 RepID=A0A1L7XC47_9HELO|nr:uncharacterized protein PAC_12517 [Phialocephala subalpina]